MEIKLKSCPFCGGKGRVRRFKDGYRIVCAECGASSHYVFIKPWHDSKNVAQCQAAKAWNCRAQVKERMDNAPLTMEKLREMALFEWLWVEVIHPTERQRFRNITSAYYQIYKDYTDGEALCCGWPGVIHEFEYEGYGKTWLAYRHKPEGENQR